VSAHVASVLDFYDRHPISESRVRAALARGGMDGRSAGPDDLYDWDQDHYGGLAAVEALARRAGIMPGHRVLDVCAGLGGPARFLAHRFGARVTALDLHAGRSAGNVRLTRLVGLDTVVRVVRGDAQALPCPSGAFDAVVSQEGLLHVPDKGRVLAECARVLAPRGRVAFSDWIATPRLDDGERRRLDEWMAAVSIESIAGYRERLARAGFDGIEAEDLSREWRHIVRQRLAVYRSLHADTVPRLGQARYDEYEQLHAFFVGLVERGKLGGARFSARAARPGAGLLPGAR
jgi:ubiquinone/menaquinone biosynthesis C-methylase UbiE